MQALEKINALLKVPRPSEFHDDDIPVFSPRSKEDREKDKYDKDFEFVDVCTAIYAFGHRLLAFGGTEGVYRTVSSLLLSNLERGGDWVILDAGCGAGRTPYDCAELYPRSLFVEMDFAYNMVERAKRVLLGGGSIDIDLSRKGLGQVTLQCKELSNVIVTQGNVLDLPFKENSFDCVINTYLIDRVKEPMTGIEQPKKTIEQMISVLKPGGHFILTDPLNFTNEGWEEAGDVDTVAGVVENLGIEIRQCFDGLVCRGVEDRRGNYRHWETLVIWGTKR